MKIRREFVETVDVARNANQIEMVPRPFQLARAFPFVPAFIRRTYVSGSAGQIAICWPEFSKDEPVEEEFIQVGGLGERGECPPLRRSLILDGKVKSAGFLIPDVFIWDNDASDFSLHALDRLPRQ